VRIIVLGHWGVARFDAAGHVYNSLIVPKHIKHNWDLVLWAEISYYEVYMDRCYDLLELEAKEIAILDDKDWKIHLRGLSRVPVKSMSEFYESFCYGVQRQKVANTDLNDVFRTHRVLVIPISTPADDGFVAVVTGKLNLIDLAGYFHTYLYFKSLRGWES